MRPSSHQRAAPDIQGRIAAGFAVAHEAWNPGARGARTREDAKRQSSQWRTAPEN